MVPEFERTTNNRVIIAYGEAGVLRKRIQNDEPFDIVFLPAGWHEIRGKVAGDPISIGHTDLGMAVPSNAPRPDIGSKDALRLTLLGARSIVYTDPTSGGISGVLFERALERLGIKDEVSKKSRLVAGALNAIFVARGEADLAVQLASEILAVPGVQFVPMPPEFHASVTFSGAVSTSAQDPPAAEALLRFLIAPSAAPFIRAIGYEPG